MQVECLASSSAGNCFILTLDINGEPVRIMVECGLSMKDIYSKLGARGIMLSSIKACLITHAHGDHCKSASNIAKLGIPLFASKDTLEQISVKGGELLPRVANRVLNGLYTMPFEVEHDCKGSFGYVIKTKQECVIFVNDHKRWNENLSNFKPDYVFIECNYEHTMVYAQYGELKKLKNSGSLSQAALKEVNMKLAQHERNLNSHCSLHGTIKGLEKLNLKNCKAIFLMHLSDRYANEYKMKNEIQNKFHIKTFVCLKNGGIK